MDKEEQLAQLHWRIQQWKSHLQFMEDEILFITRLLQSSAFKTNTPNLFERIQNYGTRIESLNLRSQEIKTAISIHENDLGGDWDRTTPTLGSDDNKRSDKLQAEVDKCLEHFQNLKSEIFNYAGGILKTRSSEG
jgi:hypothetical protein